MSSSNKSTRAWEWVAGLTWLAGCTLRGEEEEELEAGELEKDIGLWNLWLLRAFLGKLYHINELESRWQSQKRCSKIHVQFYIGSDLKSEIEIIDKPIDEDDAEDLDDTIVAKMVTMACDCHTCTIHFGFFIFSILLRSRCSGRVRLVDRDFSPLSDNNARIKVY